MVPKINREEKVFVALMEKNRNLQTMKVLLLWLRWYACFFNITFLITVESGRVPPSAHYMKVL
jgi:hypothetical protein